MIRETMKRLLADRKGSTAIEYGLILGMIVITMIVTFVLLANATTSMLNNVNAKMAAAGGAG